MAVSMNIALPVAANADEPVGSPMNSQSGARQNGLFGSIFAGLSDSDKQQKTASAGENEAGKADAKDGGYLNEAGGENIGALMRQLDMGLQSEEKIKPLEVGSNEAGYSGKEQLTPQVSDRMNVVMLKKAVNMFGRAVTDVSSDGKEESSVLQQEDMGLVANELKQAFGEMSGEGKSVPPKEGKQGKTAESLNRKSENPDELASLMYVAGNPPAGIGKPDQGMPDIPGNIGSGPEENGKVSQILSYMQSPVGQGKDPAGQKQADGVPETAERQDINRLSNFQIGKASALSERNELFAPSDKKTGAENPTDVTKMNDVKLFAARTPENAKVGDRPLSLATPVETKDSRPAANSEGTAAAGNKPLSADVEAVFHDSSPSGGFAKENGDGLRNQNDSGKTNTTPADVNMGIRSFDVTVQSHDQSQNTVSEISRPVSHEQILEQVREKLAAVSTNGDVSRITLKLHPEDLGEIRVSMKMENQSLKVDIVAENRDVRDALMHNMDSLKETLSRQNISMERFSVFTGGGYGSGENYREWKQTAQNAVPNSMKQNYGIIEETTGKDAGYLDSSDNSLIDVRF